MDKEEIYGLTGDIASLAVKNQFSLNLNKACYALGQQLKPFCFFADEKRKQYGVLDFCSPQFTGLAGESSLYNEIAEFRTEQLKRDYVTLGTQTEETKKALFFDYLLAECVCYVEVPKYTRKDGRPTPSFDKFFATKNPRLMALWINEDINLVTRKYAHRCKTTAVELMNNELRVAKLNKGTKGTSITIPRNSLDASKITVTPLFCMNAFIKGFYESLSNSILEFTFMKDNGTERVLASTISKEIMYDYYNDHDFVSRALHGVDIFSEKVGGMTLGSKLGRGYIKVPELGSSRYDSTGTRSVNIARLLKIQKLEEVSREFIDVDLSSVQLAFENGLNVLTVKHPEHLVRLAGIVGTEDLSGGETDVQLSQIIKRTVDTNCTILSTTYLRELHRIMTKHPEMFPLYTGKPLDIVSETGDVGIETMPF